MKHFLHFDHGLSGFWLVMLGSVGMSLRQLPLELWNALLRVTTMSVTVKDEDAAFGWVKEWLLEQRFQRRLRRIDLDTSVRANAVSMMPAPGDHWFWHRGRPFLVEFHRSEGGTGHLRRRTESMTFTTPGWRREMLVRFVAEIEASHRRVEKAASRLYVYDDYWSQVEAYSSRRLEAVLLPDGEKERLLEDINRFLGARERYRALGVPYHRGYLLFGPPGTGKTSLVSALAGYFGMSLYSVNLAELEDRTLKAAMNDVPENSIILMEDIDCMKLQKRELDAGQGTGRKEEANTANKSRVTLSGLLNVLDGFHAPENVLFVMTTNDAKALDAALLRPGRIDYRQFMGPATRDQKEGLYRRFFPEADEVEVQIFATANESCTMAEFQGMLLRLDEEVTTPHSAEFSSVLENDEPEPARCSII